MIALRSTVAALGVAFIAFLVIACTTVSADRCSGDATDFMRALDAPQDAGPGSGSAAAEGSSSGRDGGFATRGDFIRNALGEGGAPVLGADPSLEGQLSTFCGCRGETNRAGAVRAGGWSDLLVVLAVIAGIIGGAAASVAPWTDQARRVWLSATGSVGLAISAAAFGVIHGLGLPKRAAELDSAAEDQEYAAAVLRSEKAGPDAWSKALAACIHADSYASGARPASPESEYRPFGPGSSAVTAPGTDEPPAVPALRKSTPVAGGND